MTVNSPLRYPGGKSALTDKIKTEIDKIRPHTYTELFAGGAGIAVNLLLQNAVPEIILNDKDPAVYSIWDNIIFHTDNFIQTVTAAPVTMDEYEKQKAFYKANKNKPSFELGTAAYFLNRCNVSGVITGGPMGGAAQNGRYKIDCRFNKEKLCEKIKKIGDLRNRITLTNLDFEECINLIPADALIYADPPYVQKGKVLYKNSMSEQDHIRLMRCLSQTDQPCVISYDDCKSIRDLYKGFPIEPVCLNYSAANKGLSQEILIKMRM